MWREVDFLNVSAKNGNIYLTGKGRKLGEKKGLAKKVVAGSQNWGTRLNVWICKYANDDGNDDDGYPIYIDTEQQARKSMGEKVEERD